MIQFHLFFPMHFHQRKSNKQVLVGQITKKNEKNYFQLKWIAN